MSKIEDVMHEAYKMGVNETVINRVGELKLKEIHFADTLFVLNVLTK